MPKDRGGIGRTGHKRKLAAARRAAAAAGLPKAGATLPPLGAAAGASTDAKQVDFVPRGILKSNAGKSRSRKSKVRFASDVNEQAKGPLQGWTWGGRAVWSLDCEKLNLEINHRREEQHEHAALRARLWGELVARHVAAGCNGPWSKSYKTDLDWSYRKSHRKWCPPGLPDPGLQVGRWCYDGRLIHKATAEGVEYREYLRATLKYSWSCL